MVKELILILGIQESILTNDMGCDQWWQVNQTFLTYIAY